MQENDYFQYKLCLKYFVGFYWRNISPKNESPFSKLKLLFFSSVKQNLFDESFNLYILFNLIILNNLFMNGGDWSSSWVQLTKSVNTAVNSPMEEKLLSKSHLKFYSILLVNSDCFKFSTRIFMMLLGPFFKDPLPIHCKCIKNIFHVPQEKVSHINLKRARINKMFWRNDSF